MGWQEWVSSAGVAVGFASKIARRPETMLVRPVDSGSSSSISGATGGAGILVVSVILSVRLSRPSLACPSSLFEIKLLIRPSAALPDQILEGDFDLMHGIIIIIIRR